MPTWTAAIFRRPESGERRPTGGESVTLRSLAFSFSFRSFIPRARSSVLGPRSFVFSPQPAISRPVGFTLLELSLVLFLIGLLVTLVVPRWGNLGQARLEASAKRLAALVRYLNGEAAFHGRTYRIQYDLDQQQYGVHVLTLAQETKTFVADESPLSQLVHLPPNVTFADVWVPSVGRVGSGQVFTHFYPQGYTDPTVVHLRDQQQRTMTVIIPPLTGEAMVYEGYVDASQ